MTLVNHKNTLKKPRLRWKTNRASLVASYDIWLGNWTGLLLQLRSPHGAPGLK